MDINSSTINQYQNWLKQKGLTDHSIKRKLISLKKFLNWSEEKGIVKKNPLSQKYKNGFLNLDTSRKGKFSNWLKYGLTALSAILIIAIIFLFLLRKSGEIPEQAPILPSKRPITTGVEEIIETPTQKPAEKETPASLQTSPPSDSPWIVFYKGKLATSNGQPITQKVKVTFKVYNQPNDDQADGEWKFNLLQ